jgi:hypothetical protein
VERRGGEREEEKERETLRERETKSRRVMNGI